MASAQTLSETDRRILARWAAACAERVLPLYAPTDPDDRRVHDALQRTRAFAAGESTAAAEIRLRMVAVKAAGDATDAAGAAAARSVAQASGVAHMGAHALGAAAYAIKALTLAGTPEDVEAEQRWQLAALSDDERRALRLLPAVGSEQSGPLGSGLLASGLLGEVVRSVQAAIA